MKECRTKGEAVFVGREVRFSCEPLAIPGEVIRLIVKKDMCEMIVRVRSMGAKKRYVGDVIESALHDSD